MLYSTRSKSGNQQLARDRDENLSVGEYISYENGHRYYAYCLPLPLPLLLLLPLPSVGAGWDPVYRLLVIADALQQLSTAFVESTE